jgi:hypothetical protein
MVMAMHWEYISEETIEVRIYPVWPRNDAFPIFSKY